jgi:hypothetical protein
MGHPQSTPEAFAADIRQKKNLGGNIKFMESRSENAMKVEIVHCPT